MFQLPKGTVYAHPNDYLIQRSTQSDYLVYRVHGLFAMSLLVPVKPVSPDGPPVGYIDANTVAFSTSPQIRYLVDVYSTRWSTLNMVKQQLEANALGPISNTACIDVGVFLESNTVVLPHTQ